MDKDKKILLVASPWLGGSGSVAYRIAEELTFRDYDTHFLSYDIPFKNSNKSSTIKFHKVQSYRYPLFPFPIYELALAEKIVRVVLKNEIKIIHAHYGILFGHAAAIARSILQSLNYKVKLIITFHGSDVLGFDLEKPGKIVPKHLNTWIIDSADEITVASNNLSSHIQNIYGVKRQFYVVPNFIDTSRFSRVSRRITKPKLIHISNFRKVKQPIIVIKIFKEVLKKHPEDELQMLGDGPERPLTEKFVKNNNIPNVKFRGIINSEKDIAGYLQKAHLLLLPSLYENFPLAALEAQACGVPVISSNVGGIPEVIIDKKTGYLSEPRNIKRFVKNAESLLKNEYKWKKFSRDSQINARRYDSDKVIKQYLNIYNRSKMRYTIFSSLGLTN